MITVETLTDGQCKSAFKAGAIDELTYVTAIGASGAEYEDDDGELVSPSENEIEAARARVVAAINERASR